MRSLNHLLHAAIACVLLHAAPGAAQEVDIAKGTINGQAICGVMLDDLTGMLGRPSAVTSNEIIADVMGPDIRYHHLGLSAMFGAGETGRQPLLAFALHLSRSWDADHLEWYSSFQGTLTPRATADWTSARTLQAVEAMGADAFAEHTPEELREQWRDLPSGVTPPVTHSVTADFPSHRASFAHEPATRFLERVSITCRG